MSADPTLRLPALPRRRVRTIVHKAETVEPLACYTAAREHFGDDQVFLLESRAGPEEDVRRAVIGVGALLRVRVAGDAVSITGDPALVQDLIAQGRARGALTETSIDGGRLDAGPSSLWRLLRSCRDQFDLESTPMELAGEFSFGFFGYLGYDVARHVERLPHRIPSSTTTPEVDLCVYSAVITIDVLVGGSTLVVNDVAGVKAVDVETLAGIVDAIASEHSGITVPVEVPPVPNPDEVSDSCQADQFHEMVRRAQQHIALGDIYQVQLGHEIIVRTRAEPLEVYRRLREHNPSPYSYIADLGGRTILGASPELFVRSDGADISMRPIAGTYRRGGSEAEDRDGASRLRSDPKEKAEHVMLVDLCRNDLGRVCRTGSLSVPRLMSVDGYSHVLHLVSTVTARLLSGLDPFDLIEATFPSGTMTGAPKVRAMEIIEALETSRRGVYAGAVGLVDFRGPVAMALCIRSAVHEGSTYRFRASAGVVADSVPEKEWAETRHKLAATYWAVTGEAGP